MAVCLASCAASKRMSGELPKTFLDDVDTSLKIERLPFDHAWTNPAVRWADYDGVFIKPVRSDLLPKEKWLESLSPAIDSEAVYFEEAGTLAAYFQDQLKEKIGKREGQHLAKLAPAPGPKVAVIEIAFTELEFSHPLQKAASLLAPMPGTAVVGTALSDPYVTFALRITDGASNKLLATAGDRKFAPSRLINFSKLSATSANREICGLWAEEIAATLGSDALTKIEEKNWSWIPW